MASDFPDDSRQTDWELFPPDDYTDRLYLDNSACPTADQIEDITDRKEKALVIPRPFVRHLASEENGLVSWNSASCATPTQEPTSFLSSSFSRSSPTTGEATKMTATTPARQGVSPSSSPRLPSPPPYTEVQIGPKSPSISQRDENHFSGGAMREDESSSRRIRPGTKSSDMASGPPLIPLAQLDSPFQLQEHLKALYHTYTKSSDDSSTTPITRDTALVLATPPEGIDRQLWLYELCRFLTMRANNLIIAFFAENPPCSSHTCPEMRASEWQYLCAVHDPPKSCCAIDYCCHTLDWATNVLTSPKYFPSRLTLGSEAAGGAQASMRHLTNIFRRVYRIFAHAWFQHRGVFWQVEGHDGLYVFFKTVCDAYALIPEDNYTIPAEAEGHEINLQTPVSTSSDQQISILKPNENDPSRVDRNNDANDSSSNDAEPSEGEATTTISTGATTRRHKHTPSMGTNVTTITEGEEDEPTTNSSETSQPEPRQAAIPLSFAPEAAESESSTANGLSSHPDGDDPSSSDPSGQPTTSTSEPSPAAATEEEDDAASESNPVPVIKLPGGDQVEEEGEIPSSTTTAAAATAPMDEKKDEQRAQEPANQTTDREGGEDASKTGDEEAGKKVAGDAEGEGEETGAGEESST